MTSTTTRVDGSEVLICAHREVRAFGQRDAAATDRLQAIAVPEDIRLLCS